MKDAWLPRGLEVHSSGDACHVSHCFQTRATLGVARLADLFRVGQASQPQNSPNTHFEFNMYF